MIQTEEKIIKSYKVGITGAYDTLHSSKVFHHTLENGDSLQYQREGHLRDIAVISSARDRFILSLRSRMEMKLNDVTVGCQVYGMDEIKAIVDFLTTSNNAKSKAYRATPRSKAVKIIESSENYHILLNGKAVEKSKGEILEVDDLLFEHDIKITQTSTGAFEVTKNSYTWRIVEKERFIQSMGSILAIDAIYRGNTPKL